jgi:HlyD family secretion protein
MGGAWSAGNHWRDTSSGPRLEDLESVQVRRAEIQTTVVAGGDLQATNETIVLCQVEDITDSDGTVILSMVESGTPVKKGDELCRLDSSELEEMAREEEILLNQGKSAWVQAQLGLETAKLALREYRDGLVTQQTKEFEGRIALARSDLQRQLDRLNWTDRMVAKGYLAQAQLLTERQALARTRHDLKKTEGEFDLFRRFQVAKDTTTLRSEVGIAEQNERVEAARFQAQQERLAYVRKQIDRCTVRAPQKGIAIRARRRFRRGILEPGDRVFENLGLFRLPDLSQMDVEVSLNESMGPRVEVGMRAEVRIASLGERVIPGHVASIAPLSEINWKEEDERVRRFTLRVRLDETPPRLFPLMSAVVEIDTGSVLDALVIPVGAMAILDREPYCFVVGSGGLERRAIRTGHASRDFLEVTGGLKEGERVVVQPGSLEGLGVRTRFGGSAPAPAVTARDRPPPKGIQTL